MAGGGDGGGNVRVKLSAAVVPLMALLVVSGTFNIVSKKIAYAFTSEGLHGEKHKYKKPWSMTLVMFCGEMLCMLFFCVSRSRTRRRQTRGGKTLAVDAHSSDSGLAEANYAMLASEANDDERLQASLLRSTPKHVAAGQVILGETAAASPTSSFYHVSQTKADNQAALDRQYGQVTFKNALLCLAPACCDIFATTLSGIGLLWTTASVYQMLKGSLIVFTGTLSVFLLNRKLHTYHWVAMLVTVVGILLVGLSSYESDKHDSSSSNANTSSSSKAMVGNILVIVSQLMAALQYVVEEKFLKEKQLHPAFVVGTEGMFGVVMMLAIVLPVVAYVPGKDGDGVHENAIDSAVMLSHNAKLVAVVAAYWVSISFYNFAGLSLAKSLSAVHRTLIDACSTLSIWGVDLLLYYLTRHHHHCYGEAWRGWWSVLQLAGFLVTVYGTRLYYRLSKLPCLSYPDDAVAQ